MSEQQLEDGEKKQGKKVHIGFRLRRDHAEKLRRRAEAHGMSNHEWARELLVEALSEGMVLSELSALRTNLDKVASNLSAVAQNSVVMQLAEELLSIRTKQHELAEAVSILHRDVAALTASLASARGLAELRSHVAKLKEELASSEELAGIGLVLDALRQNLALATVAILSNTGDELEQATKWVQKNFK